MPAPSKVRLRRKSECGPAQPAPEVPFFSKRKEPKIRQRGGFLFGFSSKGQDRTSAFCVALLFCVRSREWTKSILRTFCKNLAGLLSPRPRFLSCRKERNQRFAKEEVSSLETPLRGTSPRELRKAKFSPPVCSDNKQMSGIVPTTSGSRWSRRCKFSLGSGVSKGACPFRWGCRDQEVLTVSLVTFFTQESHRGVERVAPQCSCRDFPATFLQKLPCNSTNRYE